MWIELVAVLVPVVTGIVIGARQAMARLDEQMAAVLDDALDRDGRIPR